MEEIYYEYKNFNPQGPRGPRHHGPVLVNRHSRISIHKALAGLDLRKCLNGQLDIRISIHKALAGLDTTFIFSFLRFSRFQSTRPSRASTLFAHQN